MSHPRVTALLVLGWALLYSRYGSGWRVVDEFPYRGHCERAMDAHVDHETQREIGGALANQMRDNPMRRAAYERAERRVRDRYRCESDA
jgi:hypothetical protein